VAGLDCNQQGSAKLLGSKVVVEEERELGV
jgi:hypothetical protein